MGAWIRLPGRRALAPYHYFPDPYADDPRALCGQRIGSLHGPTGVDGWPRLHSDCGRCAYIMVFAKTGASVRAALAEAGY